MSCGPFSTVAFKLARSSLMKKLMKEVSNSENYIMLYNKLYDLYMKHKGSRFEENEIKEKLNGMLKSKLN